MKNENCIFNSSISMNFALRLSLKIANETRISLFFLFKLSFFPSFAHSISIMQLEVHCRFHTVFFLCAAVPLCSQMNAGKFTWKVILFSEEQVLRNSFPYLAWNCKHYKVNLYFMHVQAFCFVFSFLSQENYWM